MFATAMSVCGRSSVEASAARISTSTPFRVRVLARDLDRDLVRVERRHGREAELRRGDREDARAAAEVEQAAALERRASSSRQSRVVACAPVPNAWPGSITTASASGVRVEPRRADPERADPHGLVELAPGVLPAGLDRLAGGVRRRPSRRRRSPSGVRVGGQLERARPSRLLEPVRAELEEAGPRLLAALDRDADGDPAKRRRSAERGPELVEEALVAPVGVVAARAARTPRARSRCSSVRVAAGRRR